ncbi:AtaL-like protein [Lysobacter capsici]|uniref:AtaL-like protein n=1 Tax=Lysobacter capsici TaxID=435897 RepID=UPI0018DFA493
MIGQSGHFEHIVLCLAHNHGSSCNSKLVNSPGQRPLTRDQVWAGPVAKARDAQLFFPPDECTRCEIVEGRRHI